MASSPDLFALEERARLRPIILPREEVAHRSERAATPLDKADVARRIERAEPPLDKTDIAHRSERAEPPLDTAIVAQENRFAALLMRTTEDPPVVAQENRSASLVTRTAEVAEDPRATAERQAREARFAAHVAAFEDRLRARALGQLAGVRDATDAIEASLRGDGADAAWTELRAAIAADRALAKRRAELMLRHASWSAVPPGFKAVNPELRARERAALAQIAEEMPRLDRARAELRIAHPALALVDAEDIDLERSNAELLAEVHAGADAMRAQLDGVSSRIAERRFPLQRLDRLVARVDEEEGISAEAAARGDERSIAVLGARSLAAEDELLLAAGTTAAAIAFTLATLGTGSAALGLIGAVACVGSAALQLDEAGALKHAAEASLSDADAMVDPQQARDEYQVAIANLALAGLDLGLAAKSAAAAMRAAELAGRYAGTAGACIVAKLEPRQIAAFERAFAGGSRNEAALAALRAELGEAGFAEAERLFAGRAAAREAIGGALPRPMFDEMHAALGDAGVASLARSVNGEELRALVEAFGARRLAELVERHGADAVKRIGGALDARSAETVFRAFRELGGDLSIVSARVEPSVLARIARAAEASTSARASLRVLGARGLADAVEAIGERGAIALLERKVSVRALDAFRRDLSVREVRVALGRAEASSVVELAVREVPAKDVARMIEAADGMAKDLGRDVASYLARVKTGREATLRELRYAEEAVRVEKLDQGHSLLNHGPQVSDRALADRLTTGRAPSGSVSPCDHSTRFESFEVFVETRRRAFEEVAKREGVDLTKPPPHSWANKLIKARNKALASPSVPATFEVRGMGNVTIDFASRNVGRGFSGVGAPTAAKTYGRTAAVRDLSRSSSKISWIGDTSDPTGTRGRWAMMQHIPDANDYDGITRSYTSAADVIVR